MKTEDAMYKAVGLGDADAVRRLVAKDPSVLKIFAVNDSWLHWAAMEGSVDVMEALVDAGISVDQLTEDGTNTPLQKAAAQGHLEACMWLLDHGADVNHGLGKVATPIFSAIYSRSLELVKLFVDRGADLSATFSKSPKIDVLRFARENGSPEILKFLKDRIGKKKA